MQRVEALFRESDTGGRYRRHFLHPGDSIGGAVVLFREPERIGTQNVWRLLCECGRGFCATNSEANRIARQRKKVVCDACKAATSQENREVWRLTREDRIAERINNGGPLYTPYEVYYLTEKVLQILREKFGDEREEDLSKIRSEYVEYEPVYAPAEQQRAAYLYPIANESRRDYSIHPWTPNDETDEFLWRCDTCGQDVDRGFGCISCEKFACVECVRKERHKCFEIGARAHTLDEVGAAYDVSRERARQFEIQALGKIRASSLLPVMEVKEAREIPIPTYTYDVTEQPVKEDGAPAWGVKTNNYFTFDGQHHYFFDDTSALDAERAWILVQHRRSGAPLHCRYDVIVWSPFNQHGPWVGCGTANGSRWGDQLRKSPTEPEAII